MGFKLSRHDIRFLHFMYKIGNILGIVPVYNFENFKITAPRLNKIYASFLFVLEIAGTLWIIYVRNFDTNIRFFTMSFKILGSCDTLLLALLKASVIIGVSYCKQGAWSKLNNKFQFVDKKLNNRDRQEKNFLKNVYVYFALSHSLYLICVVYTFTIRMLEKGYLVLKLFILIEFNAYYDFYLQMLLYNIALAFKARYQQLNEQLLHVNTGTAKKNSVYFIKEIGRLSRLLGEMVGIFNNVFGLPLVFIIGRCVIKTLASLIFFTSTLYIDNDSLKERLVISSVAQTVFIIVSWTKLFSRDAEFIFQASTSLLILACDAARSESYKTVFLCYKLREKFPDKSEEQKELLQLAQIVEVNKANFSAADFFDVNRNTLFGIFGTITTYLIVTIQFNENTKSQ
jgi:gustatory receptor